MIVNQSVLIRKLVILVYSNMLENMFLEISALRVETLFYSADTLLLVNLKTCDNRMYPGWFSDHLILLFLFVMGIYLLYYFVYDAAAD